MGQILHGKATTTHAVRAKTQESEASAAILSKKYGINPKTVLKWKKRDSVEDQRCGANLQLHLKAAYNLRRPCNLKRGGIKPAFASWRARCARNRPCERFRETNRHYLTILNIEQLAFYFYHYSAISYCFSRFPFGFDGPLSLIIGFSLLIIRDLPNCYNLGYPLAFLHPNNKA